MRVRDPVCGMEIRWEEAVDYALVGPVVVYFCCAGCASRFREDPARHVDATRWLSEQPDPASSADCGTEPLDLAGDGTPAHRSLRRDAVPRLGDLTLDDFEALVARQWCRLLAPDSRQPLRTRVLERALLVCALTRPGEERRHELDRLLAAEVARLRSKEMERDRVAEELRTLPDAFAAAVECVRLDPTHRRHLHSTLRQGVAEARAWIARRPVDAAIRWGSGPP
ncbi:MAG: hypothetical protein GWM90_25350 [Gemmatimonadetes bacterium]|nr:hypothetical protein [Gemmatimonadota bacterium]NIQ58131.1 hypothetical protein [Gemmatimonadota bacterium]NIU78335.1 hypothetical protein [Gammaproteobacteria bacterium]NIX47282.1 hypothetical protein [Gemmatimonadota bacterium]NIY11659.1 hypothetical protein [Gemmatimonadota bacterium]